MLQNLKIIIPWIIAILAIAAAVWAWMNPKVQYVPDGTVIKITEKVRVKDRARQTITTPDCTVEVIKDEQIEGNPVTAEAEIKTENVDYAVKTTITPSTGKTEIYVEPKRPDLFDFRNDKEIGFRYGLNEMELYGRWTFLRVGAFYLAGYAEASTKNHSALMLEISYRW